MSEVYTGKVKGRVQATSKKVNGTIASNNIVLTANVDKGSLAEVKYYSDLADKPSINGITVQGAKKGAEYALIDEADRITNSELETIFND